MGYHFARSSVVFAEGVGVACYAQDSRYMGNEPSKNACQLTASMDANQRLQTSLLIT